MPEAIAYTDLLLAAERARPEEAWVVRLDQALVLLRSGDAEGAVRLLREIEALALGADSRSHSSVSSLTPV